MRSPSTAIRSNRPNAAPKLPKASGDLVGRGAERTGEGGGREGVVDVVEARQRQLDPPGSGRRDQVERRAVEPAQLQVPRRNVERRARVAAVRAAVVAQMPDVRRRVVVRMAADYAVLRVGGVLQRRPGVTRVVEPEPHGSFTPAGEIRHQRIVGIHDERGLRVEPAHSLAPARSDVLELAVAVELVAEEVPEADDTGRKPCNDLGQRRLVDLEEPELRAVGREQRRSDPGDEVRARTVVGKPESRREDRLRHRRGRRLAIRGGDQRRTERKPLPEPVDRTGIELPEQLSGQGGAAAAPCEPREAADGTGRGGLDRERDRRAHNGEGICRGHSNEGTCRVLPRTGEARIPVRL